MKILEQSSERLVVQHRPIQAWLLSGLCGVFLFLSTTYFFVLQATNTQLKCQRNSAKPQQVNCQLIQSSAVGLSLEESLIGVTAAEFVEIRNDRGSSVQFVKLLHRQGETEMAYPGGTNLSEIQTFLKQSQSTSLSVDYFETKWISTGILAIISLSIGMLYFLLRLTTTATFQKYSSTFIIRDRNLFYQQVKEYSLGSIQLVEIEKEKARYGEVYRIVLCLREGTTIALNQDKIRDYNLVLAIAATMRSFLKH